MVWVVNEERKQSLQIRTGMNLWMRVMLARASLG